MTDLHPGEVVDLHLSRLIVSHFFDGAASFVLPHAEGEGDERRVKFLTLYLADLPPDAVTVHRLVPVDGEPRAGDVWRNARGEEFFVLANGTVADIDGTGLSWQEIHNGPDGPISLVYRPDEHDRKPDREPDDGSEVGAEFDPRKPAAEAEVAE